MTRSEEELFKAMSIGIMFRLGFQSLLTAAAQQRGSEGLSWLDQFESRVIADAQRMRAHEPVPDDLIPKTIEAVVHEFEQVFSLVRRRVKAEAAAARPSAKPTARADASNGKVHAYGGARVRRA